jgi:DNA-binding response OmpR family regulator
MPRVLMVEAEPSLAEAYSAVLAPAGFSCRAVQTAEQAIRAATKWIAGGLTYD